ncbi:alpha/beta-hydrolase [Hypoxylon sp. FL1284]|nr:alpha/beta-hydrolase [Hypoxylon sp. FL1284]
MASNFITTADGVRLRYTQEGPASGPAVVFVPGWVTTAAHFRKQVDALKSKYRVTTYDHRGHGASDKPAFGYRVTRLAADLDALLTALDVRGATLVGHSMGVSVVLAYWDLFVVSRRARVARVVLADQPARMTADPGWTAAQRADAGCMMESEAAYGLAGALRGADWRPALEALTASFFTPGVAPDDLAWTVAEQTRTPLDSAAALLLDHAFMDWRDVVPRVDVPALVVGCRASIFPVSGAEWMAAQIPGARLVVFEKEEGGSHFMYWENPDKFNKMLEEFLAE